MASLVLFAAFQHRQSQRRPNFPQRNVEVCEGKAHASSSERAHAQATHVHAHGP